MGAADSSGALPQRSASGKAGPEGGRSAGRVSAGSGWRASQLDTAIKSPAGMRWTISAMQSGAWARRWRVCHAPN
jgi:hypothetical protein